MYAKRPNCNESDEDLLKQQNDFHKNKTNPSVSVLKTSEDEKTDNDPKANDSVNTQLANTFETVPSDMGIGQIFERQPPSVAAKQNTLKFSTTSGFPQAKRRNLTPSTRKGSIFSQQMKKLRQNQRSAGVEVDDRTVTTIVPIKSCVLTGDDGNAIHEENVQTLSAMTAQQIVDEREKLIETMDPAIVAFLKDRRKESLRLNKASAEKTIAEKNESTESMDAEEIALPNEIFNRSETEDWLNFNAFESNKLLWMKDVEAPKISKDQSYEARFDFDGWLLPYTESAISEKSRTLYHHGDEPQRPGYTLQELFQLSRSSVLQQKIVALQTIANVLAIQSTGIYDEIIELPSEQIFFVVRFCLDDNTPSVLNASIKALRNLFCSQIDENCLDNTLNFGLGFVQPQLGYEIDDRGDDRTVNDQQMAESNLIKCFVRSDILIRIRYILSVVQPSVETNVYCLELLIRLARDSLRIATRLYDCDDLISTVIDGCLPEVREINLSSAAPPLPQAVKLLRVLAARSKTISLELVTKYNVMKYVSFYLSNDITTNTVGLKVQIECFRLWKVLLHYKYGVEHFRNLQPIIMKMLDHHVRNTNVHESSLIVQCHAASLISTITQCAKRSYEDVLSVVPFLMRGLNKWTGQICNMDNFTCSKLQLTSSIINCFAVLMQITQQNIVVVEIETTIAKLIDSNAFTILNQTIKSSSNLLNDFQAHKTGASFSSVEAAAWQAPDHVVPVLNTKSSLPFLTALSNLLVNLSEQLKLKFLNQQLIISYLQSLKDAKCYYLTSNWFSKIESELIMSIILIGVSAEQSVDVSFYYEIVIKCLCVFNSEQKVQIEYLLKNVIFNSKFFGADVLMQRLNITETNQLLNSCLDNLPDIFTLYSRVLGLRNNINDFSTNITNDIKIANALPIDWIYSPIIVLYSTHQENKRMYDEFQQLLYIKNCLKWIFIYESFFVSMTALMNPTDRFCRLACVFLCSDTLFLDSDVHLLLENCLKVLIKQAIGRMNFDNCIQGLNSFQDLFIQLLEQYQGVSYGDAVFGNFILLPLSQRHNVKWRKVLWSEYEGVVQILNLKPEQSFIPLQDFLTPEETDLSVLKCYRQSLISGHLKKDSLLFKLATHHIEKYRQNK